MTSGDQHHQQQRLDVQKTFKLYVNGAFPRSESGRSEAILGAGGKVVGHASKASRKDLRDAVVAARAGLGKWKGATAYNRGQVLYRMAEMLEGKRREFEALLVDAGSSEAAATAEVNASVDRLVCFAGWTDKYAQVLGGQNAVAGPYWNITVAEPTGVIGVVAPATPALLGLIALTAPVVCAGNTCVVISEAFAPVVSVFGEVCATCDLPAGVINLLTGSVEELAPVMAKHRDVDGVHALAGTPSLSGVLLEGAADNLKRVKLRKAETDLFDAEACTEPGWIEPFVEYKTAWHPVGA
jgi:acyl-CoA reductase-like NAD-dependent aldehyde dehydrogenase